MKPIVILLAVVFSACSDAGVSPADRDFNIAMQYGVTAANEINTFTNTCTKDLIMDGEVTVPLSLSGPELARIREKVLAIDLLNFPDTLRVESSDSIHVVVAPSMKYRITVSAAHAAKTVYWDDAHPVHAGVNPRVDALRELIALIRDIVESRPEYKRLPAARGGYV
jgi:hypothetical protein